MLDTHNRRSLQGKARKASMRADKRPDSGCWSSRFPYQFYHLSRITLHALRSSFLNSSLTIQYSYNRLNLILQIKISYFAKDLIFIIKMYPEKLSWILYLSHKAKITSETQKYFWNTALNFHLHSRLMHLTFSIEFKYSSWTHLR